VRKDFVIPITPGKRATLKSELRKFFLIDKLGNALGIILLFVVMAAIGAGIASNGIKFGVLILVAFIAMPAVYTIIAYPRIGIVVYITLAYLIMWFLRLGANFPLGTVMDGLNGLFILSIFINQKKKKDWSMFKGPVTVMILTWMAYNSVEVANPSAESRAAWLYTVRTVAIIMFSYFVFLYYINTKQYIRLILKLWLALAVFAAVYAVKQEHIGFFGFENEYLHSNPVIESLLFIGGVWRKFSIFSDPVAFSYNMVIVILLCIGLLTGKVSTLKRIILSGLILLFLMAMLYSGTRGAYVLLPAALFFLAILKYSTKILIVMMMLGAFAVVLIFIPTTNPTLYRFQTAFKPSDDASFNVRSINQKRIQPYIQSHPLGGGLGATGVWGQRFAPHSYLANFPPDSGYVRVAVEMGWLGLLIFCIFMFVVLRTGINNYYSIKDPELKSYCLACVLIVFALNIGNYPQEALVQYPSCVLFYLVIALINVTKRLDDQQNQLQHAG
jgi:hypothetical protein